MDATTPVTVIGGSVLVLIIILTGLCLNCKGGNQRSKLNNYRQK